MSAEDWTEQNNRYLAASLHWLRLRLQQIAPEEPSLVVESSAPAPSADPGGLFRRWRIEPQPKTPLLPGGPRQNADSRLKEAAAQRANAAQIDPPPALLLLAHRFGLSEFERETLLLCAAAELDLSLSALCARAQGSATRGYPTFGLALVTFEDPSWDALSAHRPLRHARLLEISVGSGTSLTSSPLRADERVVNYLKGLNVLDDRLAHLVQPVDSSAIVAQSQQNIVEKILQNLRQDAEASGVPIVQLLGADSGSKLAVALQVCAALNRRLYRLPVDALPTQVAEIETLARLWQRESRLLPVALYLDVENSERPASESNSAVQRFLSQEAGLIFLGLRETPARLNRPQILIDVEKPTAGEQRLVWLMALDGDSDETGQISQTLAGQFHLNLRDIQTAARLGQKAASDENSGGETLREALWDACRDLTRPQLDLLAQRLQAKATWDDLVLPDEQATLLHRIAGQVRDRHKVYDQWGFAEKMNRGFGISALFAGESGTGKTMAAEVLANDLRLNLYRIDLSAVVSKYIGETEKNLRQLFDAAEQGGAILFFDEADALFGKRSEVKDSHDRYANIEINYLLQRMEAFRGLAILATNMKSSLDQAFLRRLRFIVNFQYPGSKERAQIWAKALPSATPKADLDFDRLARLNLAGGHIHNIALNAAFLAAQNGQTVTMPILLKAARMELRKLDKPFNEAEFR